MSELTINTPTEPIEQDVAGELSRLALDHVVDEDHAYPEDLPPEVTPITEARSHPDNQIRVPEPVHVSVIDTEPEHIEVDQPHLQGIPRRDLGRVAIDPDATFVGTRAHKLPKGHTETLKDRKLATLARVNDKSIGRTKAHGAPVHKGKYFLSETIPDGLNTVMNAIGSKPSRNDPSSIPPISGYKKPKY